MKGGEAYHLREEAAPYKALSTAEKDHIGTENTDYWDINTEQSITCCGPTPGYPYDLLRKVPKG